MQEIATISFISSCFFLDFTSAGIIFNKFSSRFFLFNRFAQTRHPLNSQNLLSLTTFFCWCSLMYYHFVNIGLVFLVYKIFFGQVVIFNSGIKISVVNVRHWISCFLCLINFCWHKSFKLVYIRNFNKYKN